MRMSRCSDSSPIPSLMVQPLGSSRGVVSAIGLRRDMCGG